MKQRDECLCSRAQIGVMGDLPPHSWILPPFRGSSGLPPCDVLEKYVSGVLRDGGPVAGTVRSFGSYV
jgi:hypothetical protein